MAWEAELLRRTRLGVYGNCLELVEANASFAPLWERLCMLTYAGAGPTVARWLGGDTGAMWRRADEIVADIFAVTGLAPREVVRLLRQYVRIKLEEEDHLSFEEARARIYEQPFYPVVTHFTFALQPSAVARLKFVRESVRAMTDGPAEVADLGCGSGLLLCEVLREKSNWKGHGLDISSASVGYARKLAAHKGVARRAEFRTGDIAGLPYEAQSLDLVIASEVIEHLPHPERVVNGIARALKPGGRLILTVPVESHTPAHMHSLSGAEDFRALCEDAGLNIQRLKPRWHLGFGDDRKHLFALAEKPTSANVKVADADSTSSLAGAFARLGEANSFLTETPGS